MNTTIKERTLAFIKFKGITMKEFEAKCNLSTGYVTSMRKGYGPEKLSNVLSAYPELNRDWLLYDEGEMLNTTSASAPEPSSDASRHTQVPLVPIAAQGGSLSEFADSAKAYDCEKVISPIKDVDMAICVSGDSMAPEYPSGCQILVKKINERAFIDWGRVYVLDTVNGAVIKKVLPSDSPDKVLCVSINPDYPPFEVSFEHIHAFYRVMMMMSLK